MNCPIRTYIHENAVSRLTRNSDATMAGTLDFKPCPWRFLPHGVYHCS